MPRKTRPPAQNGRPAGDERRGAAISKPDDTPSLLPRASEQGRLRRILAGSPFAPPGFELPKRRPR